MEDKNRIKGMADKLGIPMTPAIMKLNTSA